MSIREISPSDPNHPLFHGDQFQVLPQHPFQSSKVPSSNTVPVQKSAVDVTVNTLGLPEVEPARMQQDKTYYVQTLRQFFYRAIHAVQFQSPEQASTEFKRYFNQVWTTGGNPWNDFGTQTWGIHRYEATLRFAEVINTISGQKASDRFVNEQLLLDIRQTLKEQTLTEGQRKPLETLVQQMQDQKALPSQTQLDVTLSPLDLIRLGRAFQAQGLIDGAERMITHAQIRSLLETYRAEVLLRQMHHRGGLVTQGNFSAFFMEHHGVPWVPVLPNPPELAKQRESKEMPDYAYYYTHNVNALVPVDKDPDDEDERRRRGMRKRRGNGLKGVQAGPPEVEWEATEGLSAEDQEGMALLNPEVHLEPPLSFIDEMAHPHEPEEHHVLGDG